MMLHIFLKQINNFMIKVAQVVLIALCLFSLQPVFAELIIAKKRLDASEFSKTDLLANVPWKSFLGGYSTVKDDVILLESNITTTQKSACKFLTLNQTQTYPYQGAE